MFGFELTVFWWAAQERVLFTIKGQRMRRVECFKYWGGGVVMKYSVSTRHANPGESIGHGKNVKLSHDEGFVEASGRVGRRGKEVFFIRWLIATWQL